MGANHMAEQLRGWSPGQAVTPGECSPGCAGCVPACGCQKRPDPLIPPRPLCGFCESLSSLVIDNTRFPTGCPNCGATGTPSDWQRPVTGHAPAPPQSEPEFRPYGYAAPHAHPETRASLAPAPPAEAPPKSLCVKCGQTETARGGDVHCQGDCDDASHGEPDGCHHFVAPPAEAKGEPDIGEWLWEIATSERGASAAASKVIGYVQSLRTRAREADERAENNRQSIVDTNRTLERVIREREEAREQRDDLSRENKGLRDQRDDLTTSLAAANARAEEAEKNLRFVTAYKDRLRCECVGALTDAEVYMLAAPHDPTGPEEVRRAIQRLAGQRDEQRAARLRAEAEVKRRDEYPHPCVVCFGVRPLSGKPCACGGTNNVYKALEYAMDAWAKGEVREESYIRENAVLRERIARLVEVGDLLATWAPARGEARALWAAAKADAPAAGGGR